MGLGRWTAINQVIGHGIPGAAGRSLFRRLLPLGSLGQLPSQPTQVDPKMLNFVNIFVIFVNISGLI